MTITLTGVAASTTPTVVKTFFRHYKTQWTKDKEDRWTEATDEIMFHEAFAIVKKFIGIATTDQVEALQRFTNTHVPAQPGTTSLRALIPLDSCDEAAKMLIEYFGEDDLRHLVGGRVWWQVRGLRGVQAEWIAMRSDWDRATAVEKHLAKGETDHDLIKMAHNVRRNKRHERKRSFAGPIRKSLDRRRSDKTVKNAAAARTTEEEGKKEAEGEKAEARGEDDLDEGKNEPEQSFEELDRLKRVMYYIHGGGYYFGSISTHRLMITRFARKFGGRAFAVNYRKAPQYPWPCAVQDVLAGYLYLIRPPPGARHEAIDPKHIVVAGDSAGGGLSLALLCILRDLELPMPAGGVLLSPWCDMTHSFPSILQNTATDIIPKYGFIHKPSTLWPVPDEPLQNADGNKKSGPQHKQEEKQGRKEAEGDNLDGQPNQSESESSTADKAVDGNAAASLAERDEGSDARAPAALNHLPAKEFTIMMQDEEGKEVPLKLTRQIQLYATNAQLFHPLCSPILQGSLGGLPPLFILAGDGEVLRDEIIYLAHRAAHPDAYPLKSELLKANKRAQESAGKFNHRPTKVHLQVYDGQPHVLTLFSFTTAARYAYRAVASFVKHVTGAPTNVINPFPDLASTESGHSDAPSSPPVHESVHVKSDKEDGTAGSKGVKAMLKLDPLNTAVGRSSSSGKEHGKAIIHTPTSSSDAMKDSPVQMSATPPNEGGTLERDNGDKEEKKTPVDAPMDSKSTRDKRRRNVTLGAENAYDGQVPLRRPTYVQEMIRERVDIRGRIRPLEEPGLLQSLQVSSDDIGAFKEGAVNRYLKGQTRWDERFKKQAKRVAKQRERNEERARIMLEQAEKEGLLGKMPPCESMEKEASQDGWADLVQMGPLALAGETPPPSAIAGRRDTDEAIELLRQALHMRAERLQVSDDVTAKVALGRPFSGKRDRSKVKYHSATGAHWKQSAAERQVDSGAKYGLKAWAGAMSFFGRRHKQHAKETANQNLRRRKRAMEKGRKREQEADAQQQQQQGEDDAASWLDESTNRSGEQTPRPHPTVETS